MPVTYAGQVKIQGRSLRGWIANLKDTGERVAFDLVIDGTVRGYYCADRPHPSLERYTAFGDGAHAFSFQLDREWITGGQQSVMLAVGDVMTGIELHAALGPAPEKYFDDEGAAEVRRPGVAEAAANRKLGELRRLRKNAGTARERAKADRRYFKILDALSRAENSAMGWRNSLLLGRELHELGRFADSIAIADRTLAVEPENFRALIAKGRSLIALNRAKEALVFFRRAAAVEPNNLSARFYVRVTEPLAAGETGTRTLTRGTVLLDPMGEIAGASVEGARLGAITASGSLAERLGSLPLDWLRIATGAGDTRHGAGTKEALNEPMLQQAGYATVAVNGGEAGYWRREALVGLAESGLLASLGDEAALNRWKKVFLSADARRALDAANGLRKVVLAAPLGAAELGDINEFLTGAAGHYRSLGYDPTIVHVGSERAGMRDVGGIAFRCVGDSTAALRRFFLEENVRLVHAISGPGYGVADALAFTNIPFIYGVHSPHDVLSDDESNDSSEEEAGTPRLRPEFAQILSRAAMVYANSRRLREIIENGFDVRCPILSSTLNEVV